MKFYILSFFIIQDISLVSKLDCVGWYFKFTGYFIYYSFIKKTVTVVIETIATVVFYACDPDQIILRNIPGHTNIIWKEYYTKL